MMTIPNMATVADIQRKYRYLVTEMKRTKRPFVILNNSDPDAVLMDIATYNLYSQMMKNFEEEYLLAMAREGVNEYRLGQTEKLKKNQKLLSLID